MIITREQVKGIEPSSSDWKSDALTVVLHLRASNFYEPLGFTYGIGGHFHSSDRGGVVQVGVEPTSKDFQSPA